MVVALRREVEELPLIVALKREAEKLKEELKRCKTTVGRGVLTSMPTTKVDMPKPKEFKGTHFAKEVDNFLWGMEQYLQALNITDEATKVSTTSMHLVDIALLWWRRREASTPAIETWEEFKREFKPHRLRDYSKRSKLLVIAREEQQPKKEEETLKLGSILFSVEPMKRRKKGLMFVDMEVVGHKVNALVDMGASDLFVSEGVAKKLGLKVDKGQGRIKTVNSKETPTMAVAQGVELKLETWSGKENIEVILLDDYDFVVSLDFLDRIRINALLVPFADCICIHDPRCQCIVPVKRDSGNATKTLSAIELAKGVKKDEETFLAALKLDEPPMEKEQAPLEVLEVLESYKDVMSAKLPKRLPSKREVDYKIELLPNAQRPTKAPYRMTPPELEELKKQLKELIDASFIHPSKAHYGAPHLRQVFEVLWAYELYVKKEKCSFAQHEVPFLGHIVGGGRIRMDPSKVCGYAKGTSDCLLGLRKQCTTNGHPLKEMTAVVHCLRTWRHYLLGSKFVVKMDNVATSYFQTQKKLTPKQARWQNFLAEFDFEFQYKLSKANMVADALSRKAALAAISHLEMDLTARIKEGLQYDPITQAIVEHAKEGKTRRFWLENDFIYTRGNRWTAALLADFGRSCSSSWGYPEPASITVLNLAAYKFAKEWQEQADLAHVCLHKAAKRTKKWADKKRRDMEYQVWDLVLVKLYTTLKNPGLHTGLVRQYKSPFRVLRRVGKIVYKLNIPRGYKFRMHPVFHVSLLKPYHADEEKPERSKSRRALFRVKTRGNPKMRRVGKLVYEGPFRVLRRVGKLVYKLNIPRGYKFRMRPVFHVSLLKPYHADEEDPERSKSRRALFRVKTRFEKEVQAILAERAVGRKRKGRERKKEYLVLWKGPRPSDASDEAIRARHAEEFLETIDIHRTSMRLPDTWVTYWPKMYEACAQQGPSVRDPLSGPCAAGGPARGTGH
ncbi:hypothetical protein CCACVL1_06931 [Corchorus capsularis]|uniref:RNA-directed DNA polymerase n=1 Tax=Corchorus capsularis TaxID=210143 RepID=A0A1R3JB14_COCAP|nr:hypothetical protein CCACVL1_06931 [Corchorus capsularis]